MNNKLSKSKIFTFLRGYSTDTFLIDRMLVTIFLHYNNIQEINNQFLRTYLITKDFVAEYSKCSELLKKIGNEEITFEDLIELFEFVISPEDKIVNGAVYTPVLIRDYIVSNCLSSQSFRIDSLKAADLSCGCGGFLYSLAKEIRLRTGNTFYKIFSEQIFGIDIQSYSVTRTKILLSLLAVCEGEDVDNFDFNIIEGDSLLFDWKSKIENFQGFEVICGNPPYVSSRNLSKEVKNNVLKWQVSKSGNPDLYIPFFQIGIENLAEEGILGYITMNTFFKSLNGRELRRYFQFKSLAFKIIDFGTTQIFKSKNTYTCICLIQNRLEQEIQYYKCQDGSLPTNRSKVSKVQYLKLNAFKGWNLQDNSKIEKIEGTGMPFSQRFKTRHGIATLKNDIFIFTPVAEDKGYYYLQNGDLYPIEKNICRDIVNTNKLSRHVSLDQIIEKVIFPYENSGKVKLLDEEVLKNRYPKTYDYLLHKRTMLDTRDKGFGDYENWYAFGRTQSLDKVKNKLFFPKMSDRTPNFIINSDENLMFYNGQAVIGHSDEEMILVKKIMESKLFWYYIQTTSKPYSSNYYSLNGSYINNFGICELNDDELSFVLKEQDKEVLDNFFEMKYQVKI